MKDTSRFDDYTEAEFLAFLRELFEGGDNLAPDDFEKYILKLVEHFELVTEHPNGSDVIFYPEAGREDSPGGILKEVKEWRAGNNKPGFKPD